jgi:hypothetical protein
MYLAMTPWNKTTVDPDHHDTVDRQLVLVPAIGIVVALTKSFGW